MAPNDWLQRLQELTYRFESLGIGADMAAITLTELWALYVTLLRLSEAG